MTAHGEPLREHAPAAQLVSQLREGVREAGAERTDRLVQAELIELRRPAFELVAFGDLVADDLALGVEQEASLRVELPRPPAVAQIAMERAKVEEHARAIGRRERRVVERLEERNALLRGRVRSRAVEQRVDGGIVGPRGARSRRSYRKTTYTINPQGDYVDGGTPTALALRGTNHISTNGNSVCGITAEGTPTCVLTHYNPDCDSDCRDNADIFGENSTFTRRCYSDCQCNYLGCRQHNIEGTGPGPDTSRATSQLTANNALQISSRDDSSCAVKSSGEVTCWGIEAKESRSVGIPLGLELSATIVVNCALRLLSASALTVCATYSLEAVRLARRDVPARREAPDVSAHG